MGKIRRKNTSRKAKNAQNFVQKAHFCNFLSGNAHLSPQFRKNNVKFEGERVGGRRQATKILRGRGLKMRLEGMGLLNFG